MRLMTGLATAALALCFPAALAQTYPSKPIRLIVPYPPGGNVDITARVVGASLSSQLKQSVIIDNRAGAEGIIGAAMVAKSIPDGYTLMMGVSAIWGAVLKANVPFDSVKDFAAISMVHTQPMGVLVNAKVPASDIRELVMLAKESPGRVTMAHAGDNVRLAVELLNAMAGVKFLPVPYKGAALALPELVGGQLNSQMTTLAGTLGFIRDGRVRALAVTTPKRSSVLPDIPTLDESGYKGFEAGIITGLLAPAATPPAIINLLNKAVLNAVRSSTVADAFKSQGADPQVTTPAEFNAYIRNDIDKWKKVAAAAGLKPE